jgi:flagellar biosynthesis protein FlhG
MIDQAYELREKFAKKKESRELRLDRGIAAISRKKIITITSGKGGVGKSSFALSLAIALAQMEKKILLVDADVALANLDVLLGFHPRYSLANVFRGEKRLEEIFLTGPAGITLLPASCGAPELAESDASELFGKFMPRLRALEKDYDFILIDTPAGLTRGILDLIFFADRVMVMTTPEPTAITDAYAMMKAIGAQAFRPEIGLLVNRALSREQAEEIFENLLLVIDRFLELEVSYWGYILQDEKVPEAVHLQKPLLLAFPESAAAACITAIARTLLEGIF